MNVPGLQTRATLGQFAAIPKEASDVFVDKDTAAMVEDARV